MRNLSTVHPRGWVIAASVFALTLLVPGAGFAAGGSEWPSAGGNLQNTRFQESENTLSVGNVGGLQVKWEFTTGGDVSATPAVDANTVYVPDWAGNLYAVDKQTGAVKWTASIPAATGVVPRQGPRDAGGHRRQGDHRHPGRILFGGGRGKVLAFNKNTGALLWSTQARHAPRGDHHAVGDRVRRPGLRRRVVAGGGARRVRARLRAARSEGSMLALDLDTGRDPLEDATWRRPGYTGNAVWGSSPAIDTKRGQVYIATGQQLRRARTTSRLRRARAGDDPRRSRPACRPTTTSTRSWRST